MKVYKATDKDMKCRGFQYEREKERSKTFPGIAKAMAEQWGGAHNGL